MTWDYVQAAYTSARIVSRYLYGVHDTIDCPS